MVCLVGGASVPGCPVVAGSAVMMLIGGIDDDEGKNNSLGGLRLAVPVAPVADAVPATVAPKVGVSADDAAAASGRVPPAGQSAT